MTAELTENQKAFKTWLNIVKEVRPRYVTFVDGDPVESGDNFANIAANASMFKTQRGIGAQMDIFDSQTLEKILT